MSKLLRLSDWILLTASLSAEVFENIRLAGEVVPVLMKANYGTVPEKFVKKSYFQTVSKLLKSGEINKKVDDKGNVSLEISNSGIEKFKRRFPIFKARNWCCFRTFS